jgi:hypothetical protein
VSVDTTWKEFFGQIPFGGKFSTISCKYWRSIPKKMFQIIPVDLIKSVLYIVM